MALRTWQLLFQTSNDPTLTIARVVLALVFLGHGTQKMLGWFGGLGFSRTLDVFEQTMGIPPALTTLVFDFIEHLLLQETPTATAEECSQRSRAAVASSAADRIQVNAVLPGPIDTGRGDPTDAAAAKMYEAVLRRVPLGRYGTPCDIAAATIFLCSPASSFVTGQTLVVDGGFVVR